MLASALTGIRVAQHLDHSSGTGQGSGDLNDAMWRSDHRSARLSASVERRLATRSAVGAELLTSRIADDVEQSLTHAQQATVVPRLS